MSEKRRSLADELAAYGRNSADGLYRGYRELGNLAAMLEAKMPEPVRKAALMVAEDGPGAGALESMRLGTEAGRLYNQGRYADAVNTFADAVDAPMKDLWWLIPGGGLIPKVAK